MQCVMARRGLLPLPNLSWKISPAHRGAPQKGKLTYAKGLPIPANRVDGATGESWSAMDT